MGGSCWEMRRSLCVTFQGWSLWGNGETCEEVCRKSWWYVLSEKKENERREYEKWERGVLLWVCFKWWKMFFILKRIMYVYNIEERKRDICIGEKEPYVALPFFAFKNERGPVRDGHVWWVRETDFCALFVTFFPCLVAIFLIILNL